MKADLVSRPRLATASAIAIIAAVAIVAALFPHTISIAELPERGNSAEDLWGRKFVAVEAAERGQSYQLPDDWPTSVTFDLTGGIRIEVACGDLDGIWQLDEGRFDWSEQEPYILSSCNRATRPHADWLTAFMAARPAWRLVGNTLELSTESGTMTMIDEGEGSNPAEILGETYYGLPYSTVDENGKPRIRANLWLSMSFDRDGTMRASLGCESVVVPTEVHPGWFRITEALRPVRTTDCSRSMAAQKTAWLWDLLRQPVQWQVQQGNSLLLKPQQPDAEVFGLGRVFEGREHKTDPGLLTGKTFYAAPHSAFSSNLDGYERIVIEVGDNSEFAAAAGCEQPSVHGTFRTGWVDFGDNLEFTLAACEDVEAEQWLGDFLAHEPTWFLRGRILTLWGGKHHLGFAEVDDYLDAFDHLPPADAGDR